MTDIKLRRGAARARDRGCAGALRGAKLPAPPEKLCMPTMRARYLCCTSIAVCLAASAAASQTAIDPQPAQWETFNVLVDFQNLPRNYSCDDLWYKFRDIASELGAAPDLTITPYDCGYVGGAESRSPQVEIKLELPRPLQGTPTRYAQMWIFTRNVMFAPGSPHSLVPSDCELTRQLVGSFFPALPLRVETEDFHCSADPPIYDLTVAARIRVPATGVPKAARPWS